MEKKNNKPRKLKPTQVHSRFKPVQDITLAQALTQQGLLDETTAHYIEQQVAVAIERSLLNGNRLRIINRKKGIGGRERLVIDCFHGVTGRGEIIPDAELGFEMIRDLRARIALLRAETGN